MMKNSYKMKNRDEEPMTENDDDDELLNVPMTSC
jgi:hypothetical protein